MPRRLSTFAACLCAMMALLSMLAWADSFRDSRAAMVNVWKTSEVGVIRIWEITTKPQGIGFIYTHGQVPAADLLQWHHAPAGHDFVWLRHNDHYHSAIICPRFKCLGFALDLTPASPPEWGFNYFAIPYYLPIIAFLLLPLHHLRRRRRLRKS